MADTSTNLSKIQRERLLDICSRIKNKEAVEVTEIAELEQFIKSMKYGLTFERHEEPVDTMLRTHIPVFKEFKEVINNPDSTDCNFLLEGDNLHSLKLLEKTHKGVIDVIYIDPPYNTLNDDFAYGDKMLDENDGFVHSKWLSFMKERLELARKLLSSDGVMFISIDDNEYANLKLLCNHIFGEQNVDTMIWRKSGVGRDGKMKNTTTFRKDHEYIIACFKEAKQLNKIKELPNFTNEYSNADNDTRGPWMSGSLSRSDKASNPNHKNYYTVTSPIGKKITRQFEVSREEFDKLNDDNRISWGKNNDSVPRVKIFINEEREITPYSILLTKGTTTEGTKELNDILAGDYTEMRPKPSNLIKTLVQIGSKKDSICLDFFAGSGTTGQAVLQLNNEDGGKRRFILCTNNEISAIRTLDYLHANEYMLDVAATGKNKTTQNKIDKFFEENPDAYQQLIIDSVEEYKTYGICQSITYARVQTIITGLRPDGSKYSDGIKANLKYFQTDMIDKTDDDLDELLYEASFYLAELENMAMIDNVSICIANCDEDIDDIITNATEKLKEIFIADDVLLSSQQKDFFMRHNVAIKQIPNYYYKEM